MTAKAPSSAAATSTIPTRWWRSSPPSGKGPRGRQGNAQAPNLLQDCFRAADGTWIAVSALAGDLPALAGLLGIAPDADAAALRGALGRTLAAMRPEAAVAALRGSRIAAAPVLDGAGTLRLEGEFWSHALQRLDGAMVKGFPFQIEEEPLAIHRPAPGVGAHTGTVLAEIAGFGEDEIAELLGAGIIEFRPG
jgi:crotonobetainyl-CoA:carnitine CoA-transferase CaiB-like acyl-CoA transferase